MKPTHEKPSAAEFGQLVAFLVRNGVTVADVHKRIGTGVGNRTRAEILQALRDWLKTGVL